MRRAAVRLRTQRNPGQRVVGDGDRFTAHVRPAGYGRTQPHHHLQHLSRLGRSYLTPSLSPLPAV
jgi:hypothetical protein